MGLEMVVLATAAVATATGGYQAYESHKQRKDMKKEAERQRAESEAQEKKLREEQKRDQLARAQMARRRTEVGIDATQERGGGTLLTSPIGTTVTPNTGTKSLLGQ